MLAVNLEGVVLGCRHALRAMRESGGSIVNVASRAGTIGVPGALAYAASKAAVLSVSRSVALHCASSGYPVRCNAVVPGAIDTPMWSAVLGEGPDRAGARRRWRRTFRWAGWEPRRRSPRPSPGSPPTPPPT